MSALAAVATGVVVAAIVGAALRVLPRTATRRHAPRRRLQARREWLAQAGVAIGPLPFWGASAALGGAVGVLLASLTGTAAAAAVPALATALVPRAVLSRRREARLGAIRQAWPDALRELAAAVAAGRSLTQALSDLGDHGSEPLASAFASFATLARVLGTATALEVIRDDLADPTTDRVVEVLILAHEQGGRLVGDLLRDLAETTSRDLHTAEEVAANALEQKINARAVFVLPWLVLVVLVARPGHFRDFYQSPGGVVVLVLAAAMSAAGLALAARLSRQPVEPRLLAAGVTPRARP